VLISEIPPQDRMPLTEAFEVASSELRDEINGILLSRPAEPLSELYSDIILEDHPLAPVLDNPQRVDPVT